MPVFPAITDVLFFVGIIIAFIIFFLIPKEEDVKIGKIRFKMDSPMVPILISLTTILGIVVLSLSFLQETLPIGSIIGAIVLLLVSGMSWLEFTKVKKLNDRIVPAGAVGLGAVPQQPNLPPGQVPPLHEVQHVEAVSVAPQQQQITPASLPQSQPAVQTQALPQAPAQPHSIRVECPQCSSHIDIPPGSNQIVCPHCGLSGTM